jgi:hypothetical protein
MSSNIERTPCPNTPNTLNRIQTQLPPILKTPRGTQKLPLTIVSRGSKTHAGRGTRHAVHQNHTFTSERHFCPKGSAGKQLPISLSLNQRPQISRPKGIIHPQTRWVLYCPQERNALPRPQQEPQRKKSPHPLPPPPHFHLGKKKK